MPVIASPANDYTWQSRG